MLLTFINNSSNAFIISKIAMFEKDINSWPAVTGLLSHFVARLWDRRPAQSPFADWRRRRQRESANKPFDLRRPAQHERRTDRPSERETERRGRVCCMKERERELKGETRRRERNVSPRELWMSFQNLGWGYLCNLSMKLRLLPG